MSRQRASGRVGLVALRLGVAVPFLYYGIQVAAAPFFPGFSVVHNRASELGSDLSQHPFVFNVGIMTLGVVTLLAAVSFLLALRQLGTHPALASATAGVVALNGVQSLWAGIFPIPDPRHGGQLVFVIGMTLLPPLLTAVVWRHSRSRALKVYFVATLALHATMILGQVVVSGHDRWEYRGLFQRVFTLAIYPPVAVAAYVLARRVEEL
jgi:hypothetical membrane protein